MRKPFKNIAYVCIGTDTDLNDKDSGLFKINRQIEIIDNSLTNFDSLSNVEKFKLLSILYSFYICYEDLMELVNHKYNKHFNKILSLSTTMEDEFMIEGTIDKYGITLDCAMVENFVPKKRRYSYDEINTLINDGIIHPLFARAVFRHNNFVKDEVNTNLYYDAEENSYMVDIILNDKKINVFVPNDINLFRDSGFGMFNIDENLLDENSASLLMELYSQYLTKTEIFNTAKHYILQSLAFLGNATYYNSGAQIVSSKIKKYYNNTFLK